MAPKPSKKAPKPFQKFCGRTDPDRKRPAGHGPPPAARSAKCRHLASRLKIRGRRIRPALHGRAGAHGPRRFALQAGEAGRSLTAFGTETPWAAVPAGGPLPVPGTAKGLRPGLQGRLPPLPAPARRKCRPEGRAPGPGNLISGPPNPRGPFQENPASGPRSTRGRIALGSAPRPGLRQPPDNVRIPGGSDPGRAPRRKSGSGKGLVPFPEPLSGSPAGVPSRTGAENHRSYCFR
jgi:hypothetical protein